MTFDSDYAAEKTQDQVRATHDIWLRLSSRGRRKAKSEQTMKIMQRRRRKSKSEQPMKIIQRRRRKSKSEQPMQVNSDIIDGMSAEVCLDPPVIP